MYTKYRPRTIDPTVKWLFLDIEVAFPSEVVRANVGRLVYNCGQIANKSISIRFAELVVLIRALRIGIKE